MPDWFNGPVILGAFAGFLAIAAAIWSSIEEDRHNKELNVKSNEIIRLQADQLGFFRGSGSIFYLHFVHGTISGMPEAHQMVRGQNPIPTLGLVISSLEELAKSKDLPWEERRAKAFKELRLKDVWPESELSVPFPFPEDPQIASVNYHIRISQPEDKFVQLVCQRRLDDGSFVFAYRVFRQLSLTNYREGLREVRELRHVGDRYPRISDGRVEFLDEIEKWKLRAPVVE